VPVLATTATANARVTRDVAEQLGAAWHGPGEPPQTLVLRGPLDRESLRLAVVRLPTAPQRLAWLADRLAELPGSGIVYTLTVAAAHDVADFLRDRGYAAEAYTGQTDPAQRLAIEDDLLGNKLKAVVATSALGMGFDKPDLGFIVHLGAPPSPVAYYQQIGRAGRGVERAEVILLPATEDRDIWAYFASLAFPPEREVRAALAALAGADGPQSLAALEARVDLSRTRLEIMLKVLDVDGAVRRVPGGWTATGQQWGYDKQRYDRVAAERSREQDAMLGYAKTGGCRMEYLRRELDDPQAAPCGRCDNCTGAALAADVVRGTEELARDRLRRPGVTVTPRRLWPTGMAALGIAATGRIPAEAAAEPGRSVGRLTDIGWGGTLRRILADGAPDEPVAEDLFGAVLTVLAAWDWAERPAGVVSLPSRSRPVMISSLGQRIAVAGKLSYLGSLGYLNGGPAGRHYNSAQRLAALWRTLAVPAGLRGALAGFGGPVLLVDDRIGTGWTMTVAAKLLRECDVPAVLPFALAVTT
jgi:ATP-dependent DNA helicase RecQ